MVSLVIAALSGTASIGTAGLMDALNKADLAPTVQAAAGAPAPRVFGVRLAGLHGGAVSCRDGVSLQPAVAAADVAAPDLVVVPGLDDDLAASFDANRGWVPWLASWHAAGARIVSSCTGAFLVADAGRGRLPAMNADYPEHLLAREPAPPYDGEGRFALWHFSEDPSLRRFRPHRPATNPDAPPLVWAVDTRHAPTFWFPRDCPRGCIWPVPATTLEDRERFFGQSAANRIHVVEAGWLGRMQACRLYVYRLPAEAFRPHEVGGYWVADEPVDAIEQVILDDLPGRHASAGIELRITPSIWPFWRRVVNSTVEFSGSRLGNSAPHPDQFE